MMKFFVVWVAFFSTMPVFVHSSETLETPPQVLGYGVRSCSDYIGVYEKRLNEEDIAALEYLRYRGWLSGFVTGLSLATGTDVLQGVEVESAMRRIQIECEDNPKSDFFTATSALIKLLSKLQ